MIDPKKKAANNFIPPGLTWINMIGGFYGYGQKGCSGHSVPLQEWKPIFCTNKASLIEKRKVSVRSLYLGGIINRANEITAQKT